MLLVVVHPKVYSEAGAPATAEVHARKVQSPCGHAKVEFPRLPSECHNGG